MTASPSLRDARPEDGPAIAALHLASRRVAYRGILDDDYLDGRAAGEGLSVWRERMQRSEPPGFVLLAEGGGSLLGFVAVSIGSEPGWDATIDNLHVRPELRGGGIGRTLIGGAATRLVAAGNRSACLWLFDGNARAGRFYGALGGIPADRGFDAFSGMRIPHTRIVWRDVAALAAACAAPSQ